MEQIRVLHAVVCMDRGGYETLLMNLLRNIDRRAFRFDFLSSMPGTYDAELGNLGAVIHYVPFITAVGPFRYADAIRSLLAEYPPYHIVHAHMDKFSGLVLKQAHCAGVPVRIAHAHSTHNEGGLCFRSVKNYYGMSVVPHASHLLACSKDAAKWMYGRAAPHAIILPNGIDLAQFTPNPAIRRKMRQEFDCKDHFIVGHVGRFTKPKNHAFILEIFSALLKIRPDARLIFVGDGPLRQAIESRVSEMKLDNHIRFLGVRNDVPSVLQALDCFLFPSLHEGLGLGIVEAQAAGLPCVCSTAIPREAHLTPNLSCLSLAEPPSRWAQAILTQDAPYTVQGELAHFDIHRVSSLLSSIYQAAVG